MKIKYMLLSSTLENCPSNFGGMFFLAILFLFFFFPGTCVMRLRLIVPNLLLSMHVHDSYFRKESNV